MDKIEDSRREDFFSPQQRKIVAVGLTSAALVVIALTLFEILKLARSAVITFSGVIWPLATALILMVLLRPAVDWLVSKTKWSRTKCVLALFLIVGLSAALVASILLPILVSQTLAAIRSLPDLVGNIIGFFTAQFPDLVRIMEERVGPERTSAIVDETVSWLQRMSATSLSMLQGVGRQMIEALKTATLLGIIPVYLFYFMVGKFDAYGKIEGELDFLKDKWREDLITLTKDFVRYVVAFFRGQIVVAAITGCLLALGFTLVGLQFGFLIGLFLGALNIIPFLGTIIGLATALPVAYFQPEGGVWLLVLVLGVFTIVQTLESNVISPKVMGKETGLHPVAIIVAIFFWGTALDGILGMILAVPLTAFLVSAWELLRRRYLAESDLFGKERKDAVMGAEGMTSSGG